MSQIGLASSTTTEFYMKCILFFPQPLFLISVLVPSVLFDPVFELPFIAIHIFFTILMGVYSWALYILRTEDTIRPTLTVVTFLSISMWLLLAGVDDDPLYKRIWTGIYFQNVCLQTILFTIRNKNFI